MHDGAVDGNPYRHYSITLPTEAGTVYGASVIVGTNAVKVSLAQALNEINA